VVGRGDIRVVVGIFFAIFGGRLGKFLYICRVKREGKGGGFCGKELWDKGIEGGNVRGGERGDAGVARRSEGLKSLEQWFFGGDAGGCEGLKSLERWFFVEKVRK